ncbi:hypothetical protein RND81_02G122600 [Saponaria officinalis]|uniref:Glycosyl transferase CAP10 domain-containing protein n=1 Tax=Saponaria officinalis TaxID=3572 RepID=A0AAW1MSB7_SAPOF
MAILLPSYWVALMDNSTLREMIPFHNKGSKKRVVHEDIQPIICSEKMSFTCPRTSNDSSKFKRKTLNPESCPDYFTWIHEDLKPWKSTGITQNMLKKAINIAHFRLVIVNGKAYVEKYKQPYQTRDVVTLWGILQLMKMYSGKLPDLDLMFQCGDKTVVKKKEYQVIKGNIDPIPPPIFHYCGDDLSFDIVFPDWTFWGWSETFIRPWDSTIKELKDANDKMKWVERKPYAFYKGNLFNGHRDDLAKCNSTKDWNAQIYNMNWDLEMKEGFKDAKMAKQCMHKYKIYMEGNAWSVSRKYIMACNSMSLVVNPEFYDFFSRSLIPFKHYWPIDAQHVCKSIKFAVDWGNNHSNEAKEIGKEGSKFIQEKVKMKHVYDYMYHLLIEYAKLLKYKPSVPKGALELCSKSFVCPTNDTIHIEESYKLETLVNDEAQEEPCSILPSYDSQKLVERNHNIFKQILL